MTFDLDTARTAAELCHISYYDVRRESAAYQRVYHKKEHGGLGLRNFNAYESADRSEFAFTAHRTHGDLYVVFRGTPNPKKIGVLSYLTAWPFYATEPNGRAHSKFVRALDQLWPALRASFDFACTRTGRPMYRRIIWTGHSAGGALAILAAARFDCRFAADPQPQHCVYTFGQPRVGGADFWAKFDKWPVFRVIRGNDIVPRLPPPLPGFRHRGNLVHVFEQNGGWATQYNPGFGRRLATFWRHGLLRPDFLLTLKTHHYTAGYLAAMRGA